MKKRIVIIMIAVMLAIPAAVFAGDGLSIGATAMLMPMQYDEYNDLVPVSLGDIIDNADLIAEQITAEDLMYGAELRLDFSLFQISNLAFYDSDLGVLMGMADAGLYLDLGIIGLGAGVGANYLTDFTDGVILAYNAKVNADLILGPFILSSYVMGYTDDPEAVVDENDIGGIVGVSALFQL